MDVERELAELKQRRRNVRPEELHRLFMAAGFTRSFGKGDHWVYRHPSLRRSAVVDPRTPVYPAYVTLAIKAIEEVLRDAGR